MNETDCIICHLLMDTFKIFPFWIKYGFEPLIATRQYSRGGGGGKDLGNIPINASREC